MDNILKYEDQEYLLEHCLGNEFDQFMLIRSELISGLQEAEYWAYKEIDDREDDEDYDDNDTWADYNLEDLYDLRSSCLGLVNDLQRWGNFLFDPKNIQLFWEDDPAIRHNMEKYLSYIHKAISFIEEQNQQRFSADQFFGIYLDN